MRKLNLKEILIYRNKLNKGVRIKFFFFILFIKSVRKLYYSLFSYIFKFRLEKIYIFNEKLK